MNQPFNILKVKDKNEKHYIDKFPLSDLPGRIIIIGKSMLSGKTNFLVNLLLRPEAVFYKDDFKGENIYLISGSTKNDAKLKTLIEQKEIENIFTEYDETQVEALYEMIQEEFEEAIEENKVPNSSLIIFDDMSFSGVFKGKDFGIINKIFSNGRHINLSCIVTSQKYTNINTSIRENSTMGIFFNCSDKQLDVITEDVNYVTTKKEFKKKFREVTAEKHSFMVVNFTNDKEYMYMDSKFQPIVFEQPDEPTHHKEGLNKDISSTTSVLALAKDMVSRKL
jgi:hypothetical protein